MNSRGCHWCIVIGALLFGELTTGNNTTRSTPTHDDPPLVDLSNYACVQKRGGGQDPNLSVVVAISGGGYRSANVALGALLALERIQWGDSSDVLNEVDYYSTVSGGGIATAAVMMSRVTYPTATSPLSNWMKQERFLKIMRTNHTVRLILSTLRPDNIFTGRTRGDDLQMRLDQDLLSTVDMHTLGDIFKAKDSDVPHPYWFMNSTDMSTGKIIPFTPANLKQEAIREYWHGRWRSIDPDPLSVSYFDIPIAVGLRSSMNYPVAIPSTTLERSSRFAPKNGRFLHLSDGGLADNIGVIVGVTALNEEVALDCEREGHTEDHKRLLIVIDAFRGAGKKISERRRRPGTFRSIARGLNLPLEAHRYRIRQDYSDENAHRLSVLDVMGDSDVLGVVYIHMESEKDVEKTRTNLYVDAERQHKLICAGLRQTFHAFGVNPQREQGIYSEAHPPCDLSSDSSGSETGVLIFGKREKYDLMATIGRKLIEASTDTVREARGLILSVNGQVDLSVEEYRKAEMDRGILWERDVVLPEVRFLDDDDRQKIRLGHEYENFHMYLDSLESLIGPLKSGIDIEERDGLVEEREGLIGRFVTFVLELVGFGVQTPDAEEPPEEISDGRRKRWRSVLSTLEDLLLLAKEVECQVEKRVTGEHDCVTLDDGRGALVTPVGLERAIGPGRNGS